MGGRRLKSGQRISQDHAQNRPIPGIRQLPGAGGAPKVSKRRRCLLVDRPGGMRTKPEESWAPPRTSPISNDASVANGFGRTRHWRTMIFFRSAMRKATRDQDRIAVTTKASELRLLLPRFLSLSNLPPRRRAAGQAVKGPFREYAAQDHPVTNCSNEGRRAVLGRTRFLAKRKFPD